MNTFVCRWGMDLHFILGFVENSRRRAQIGANILTAVAEKNIAGEALLAWFQGADGSFGEKIHSNSFRSAWIANNVRWLDVKPARSKNESWTWNLCSLFSHFVETRDRKWRWFTILNVIAAVQCHLRHNWRISWTKMQRSKTVTSEICLHFAVDMEIKRQSTKVQSKRVLGSVIDGRMSWSKRVLNLLDRR